MKFHNQDDKIFDILGDFKSFQISDRDTIRNFNLQETLCHRELHVFYLDYCRIYSNVRNVVSFRSP